MDICHESLCDYFNYFHLCCCGYGSSKCCLHVKLMQLPFPAVSFSLSQLESPAHSSEHSNFRSCQKPGCESAEAEVMLDIGKCHCSCSAAAVLQTHNPCFAALCHFRHKILVSEHFFTFSLHVFP